MTNTKQSAKNAHCTKQELQAHHYNCEAMKIASMPGGGTTIKDVHDAIEQLLTDTVNKVLDGLGQEIFSGKPILKNEGGIFYKEDDIRSAIEQVRKEWSDGE